MPRGVGLDILKEFVSLNKGKLEIYTNECCAYVNESGEYEIEELDFNFTGTLALISINLPRRYCLFISKTKIISRSYYEPYISKRFDRK